MIERTHSLQPGQRLGPYEIEAFIAGGGMGEVYKARDTRLGRIVALKRLTAHAERFEHEARSIAALNHPHICQVYDVGPDYLVLEFVDGRPVSGPLALDRALPLATQIVGALEEAHTRGILHRDLKPSNILVATSGDIKLLDFGLAKLMSSDVDVTRTSVGTVLGTVAYMSPEQAEGHAADARSDIFSFGAVLYELVSGRRPFEGATDARVFSALLRDDPPPLESGSAALDRLVYGCLTKTAARRPQTMTEVKTALEAIVRERATTSSPSAKPSIVVLPFADMGPAKDHEWFSDGLTEEIISALAHIDGLRVIARTSAFAFKNKQEDIRRIAEAVGVVNVLEGSVRRSGDRIRVTAQLIAAGNGSHLWSERYDREMTDVFAIQDDIAEAIAKALQVKLSLQLPARRGGTSNLPAYEAYLKGRFQWAKLTPESLERSRQYYEDAIALDPQFALAHAFLAEHYFAMATNGAAPPRDLLPRARAGAEEAIRIEPSLSEAQALLGSIAGLYDHDWTEGAYRFRLATASDPVPPHTRLHYGYHLLVSGDLEGARRQYERAIAEDPLNVIYRFHLAGCLTAAGALEEAVTEAHKSLEIEPTAWALLTLGVNQAALGKLADARITAERLHRMAPWHANAVGLWAAVLSLDGETDRSTQILETLNGVSKQWVGLITFHLVRGEFDRAADYAARSIADRDITVPALVRMNLGHQHPRWIALARVLKFPDYIS